MAYASPLGRALIDRDLYLPTSWTEDRDRCAAAGVSAEAGFATNPQLALQRWPGRTTPVPTGWVTPDEAPTARTAASGRGWPPARYCRVPR